MNRGTWRVRVTVLVRGTWRVRVTVQNLGEQALEPPEQTCRQLAKPFLPGAHWLVQTWGEEAGVSPRF